MNLKRASVSLLFLLLALPMIGAGETQTVSTLPDDFDVSSRFEASGKLYVTVTTLYDRERRAQTRVLYVGEEPATIQEAAELEFETDLDKKVPEVPPIAQSDWQDSQYQHVLWTMQRPGETTGDWAARHHAGLVHVTQGAPRPIGGMTEPRSIKPLRNLQISSYDTTWVDAQDQITHTLRTHEKHNEGARSRATRHKQALDSFQILLAP